MKLHSHFLEVTVPLYKQEAGGLRSPSLPFINGTHILYSYELCAQGYLSYL